MKIKFCKKIQKMVYSMIDVNQDIFTTEDFKVGKISSETFRIELLPNAKLNTIGICKILHWFILLRVQPVK